MSSATTCLRVPMSSEPLFKVEDEVQFGYGTVPYKVVAVITTGRVPTYDVICVGGLRPGRRYQGVREGYLKHYYKGRHEYYCMGRIKPRPSRKSCDCRLRRES